jgi:hypothetical protein
MFRLKLLKEISNSTISLAIRGPFSSLTLPSEFRLSSSARSLCNGILLLRRYRSFTPVCTTVGFWDSISKFCRLAKLILRRSSPGLQELSEAAKLAPEFKKRGVKLIGLSCNELKSHGEWIQVREFRTFSFIRTLKLIISLFSRRHRTSTSSEMSTCNSLSSLILLARLLLFT